MTRHGVETDRLTSRARRASSQASRRRVHPRALAGVSACGPLTTVVAPGCVSIRGEGRSATGQIADGEPTREGDES